MPWDNIVEFPHTRKPRISKNGTPEAAAVVELEAQPTAKRDGRKLRGNPLRLKCAPISPAVTIVGKMHTAELRRWPLSNLHPDIIQQWLGELRAGAENARIVADELDRAAEHLLSQSGEQNTPPTPEESAYFRDLLAQL